MTYSDILKYALVCGGGFLAGFLAGSYFEGRKHECSYDVCEDDICEYDSEWKRTGTDRDGDYLVVPGTKPDIFELSSTDLIQNRYVTKQDFEKTVYSDYSKKASEYSTDVLNQSEVVEKNIFAIPEHISIISEEEAHRLVESGEDTLSATYFPEDGILAGFDDSLEVIDASEYDLSWGVDALMESDGGVYVHNSNEGVVYEIVAASGSYEEAAKEVE